LLARVAAQWQADLACGSKVLPSYYVFLFSLCERKKKYNRMTGCHAKFRVARAGGLGDQ
jgi:hypothetical protein